MTDKEREIIENCEISDILDIKGKENLLDEIPVHDIALHYDLDDILDEYRSDSDIAEYLDNKGYDFSRHIDYEEDETEIDNNFETDLLVTLCRKLHPHGVLMKEDIREIVKDYINNMINRSY